MEKSEAQRMMRFLHERIENPFRVDSVLFGATEMKLTILFARFVTESS